MNNVLHQKDIIHKVSDKLLDRKIVRGGKKKSWKSKYHLKYSQDIIKPVLDAFFDVVADAVEEGDSVQIYNYFSLEPQYYKERTIKTNDFCGTGEIYVPPRYKVKLAMGNKLKKACEKLYNKKMNGGNL
ncbi:MAG: HU family DNA-binding protein [Candidatus Ornithomonoglobus sp.]